MLAALSHFSQPARLQWVAEMAGLGTREAETALDDLTNRALVIAGRRVAGTNRVDKKEADEIGYLLPPLAGTFVQRKKPEAVEVTGEQLCNQVYALAVENGYKRYERFPKLEREWERLRTALPLLVRGENGRLQTVCDALTDFLDFSGRWDEWLWLSGQGEDKAVEVGDWWKAGWRAYWAGWVYQLWGEADEVLPCAERVVSHWAQSPLAGVRERAVAIRLRGVGHKLQANYAAAMVDYGEALALWRLG